MLILSRHDVEILLDLDVLVDAVASAMADLSAGRTSLPPRMAAFVPERSGMLAAMPVYLRSAGMLATKLVSVFPENQDRPTHQAVICCFDPDTGTPVALLDGTFVTAARTAAGSALATTLLARPRPRVIAVIGTGVQARAHARAMARIPGVETILMAGRNDARAAGLATDLAAAGIPAAHAPGIEDAVRSADVVCVATHADAPVIQRQWLRSGTHVNSVGYNPAGTGEIDGATVKDSLVVVESRAAALAPPPSGAVELLRAVEHGTVDRDFIHAELGELISNGARGRTDDDQLTLYKSVGVAVQDAAAAAVVLREAERRGFGQHVDLPI